MGAREMGLVEFILNASHLYLTSRALAIAIEQHEQVASLDPPPTDRYRSSAILNCLMAPGIDVSRVLEDCVDKIFQDLNGHQGNGGVNISVVSSKNERREMPKLFKKVGDAEESLDMALGASAELFTGEERSRIPKFDVFNPKTAMYAVVIIEGHDFTLVDRLGYRAWTIMETIRKRLASKDKKKEEAERLRQESRAAAKLAADANPYKKTSTATTKRLQGAEPASDRNATKRRRVVAAEPATVPHGSIESKLPSPSNTGDPPVTCTAFTLDFDIINIELTNYILSYTLSSSTPLYLLLSYLAPCRHTSQVPMGSKSASPPPTQEPTEEDIAVIRESAQKTALDLLIKHLTRVRDNPTSNSFKLKLSKFTEIPLSHFKVKKSTVISRGTRKEGDKGEGVFITSDVDLEKGTLLLAYGDEIIPEHLLSESCTGCKAKTTTVEGADDLKWSCPDHANLMRVPSLNSEYPTYLVNATPKCIAGKANHSSTSPNMAKLTLTLVQGLPLVVLFLIKPIKAGVETELTYNYGLEACSLADEEDEEEEDGDEVSVCY